MKRAIPLFAAILCWCLPALAAPPAPSPDEQLVSAAFPAALDLGGGGEKTYDFARADLAHNGSSDYIVAVYGGDHGIVRVLQPTSTGSVVAAEADYPAMGGQFPRLRLVDLNRDGTPEIVASFATAGGGEETWIFRWGTNQLSLLGPTTVSGRHAIVHSTLAMSDFFDLDGDGVPEIVEFDGQRGDQTLKRQANGTYVRTGPPLVYVNRYERQTTEPELFTGVFPSQAGQTLNVKMVVAPGSAPPQGDLYINGQLVFDHPVFTKGSWMVEATITAQDINEVESMLDGPVGSAVNVVVTISDDIGIVGIE
jgi:hypothetical protein